MVCGFCSTGCSLDVHLTRRPGGQPHAHHRLPRQPRHGLPEGLGGAHAAAAPPTAAPRRCWRDSKGKTARRSVGTRRITTFVERSARSSTRARPRVGRVPRRPARSRPRRWRSSARSPSSAWAWCTATATRASAWPRRWSPTRSRSASTRRRTPTPTSKSPTSSCCSGRTCASRTRSCGSACCRNPHNPEIIVVDPRRTETASAATQHLRARAEERPRRCSTASPTC